MAKQIVNFLNLLGIAILLFGAAYMALSHQAYAIAGCFFIAAILLILIRLSPNRRKNTNTEE